MPDGEYKRNRGRPRSAGADKGAGAVQALQRGIVLLGVLARDDKATLTELALATGMPPSTAHRLLMTLQAHGYTDFDEATNMWMVGVEAFRTGNSFLRRTKVAEAAREIMRDLVAQTGETANLAVADEGEVVFLSQVECPNPIRASFPAGARTPMHASGIGKAMMATLERAEVERLLQKTGLSEFTQNTLTSPGALFDDLATIKQRGWALDDEERHPGMRCVAAPVFNHYAEAVAGLSISGPVTRFTNDAVGEFGPVVRRAAARVTEAIGGKPPG